MARRPLHDLTAAALVLAALLLAGCSAGAASSGTTTPGQPGPGVPAAGSPSQPSTSPDGGTTAWGNGGSVTGAPRSAGDAAGPVAGATAAPAGPVAGATTAPAGTPDAAALAATTAWLSHDTRVDARPNDTARRLALPWLAPALRRQVLAFTSAAAPGAEWAQWSSRHAHATVVPELGGDDHPPDTADTAWRQVVATINLRGDAGWTDTVQRTIFVQLGLVDGRWLVTDLRTAPLA